MVQISSLPLFLSFIIISMFSQTSSGQYASMLGDSSSKWFVNSCNGTKTQCISDFYSSRGDTTVAGLDYKFMQDFHFNKQVLIREDTTIGKVYLRPLFGFRKYQEVLLYDFSLSVGNAISVYNPNSPIPDSLGTYEVDSIGHITLNGRQRKMLFLQREPRADEYNETIWVEGLGSLSLINTPGQEPDISGVGELGCFYRDSVLIYQSSFNVQQGGKCNIYFNNTPPISTILTENSESELSYDRQSVNRIKLVGAAYKGHIDVCIVNMNGSQVLQAKKNPDESIDLSGLSKGIYVIQLRQGAEVQHHKIWR